MRILTPYEQWLLTNGSLLFRSTGPNPILSHFYLCNIKINEFEYSSIEQAYQFFKVKNIFKDDENGKKILPTSNPHEQKSIGSCVQSKDHLLRLKWDRIKELIIFALDKEKYRQMPNIKQLFDVYPDQKIYEFVRCSFWVIGCKIIIHNSQKGGENKSGKIWERIHSGAFPEVIALSDETLENIIIPQMESYVIPEADFSFISAVAKLTKFLPSRGIIIHAGANDLYDETGSFRSVNLLARRMLNTATFIAENNPDVFILLSPILPRNICTNTISKVAENNQKIRTIAEIVKAKKCGLARQIYLLDVFDIFWDGFHTHQNLFETDGLHLSHAGKMKFSELMYEAVTSLISNTMQSYKFLV